MFNNLFEFYRSDEWARFRQMIIAERTRDDGFIYDEITNKPILKPYDLILHHSPIELTEENVKDFNISLNPDNIKVVSFKTHNILHDRLGMRAREVYLVYGSPLSGKSTWVSENMSEGDLIIDFDNIWQAISGQPRYIKPKRLNAVAFKVRDTLIDAVKYRLGKWNNAFITGGYALASERERIAKELGAREIFIECDKAECIRRLEADEARDTDEWRKYIDDWFETFEACGGEIGNK